MYSRNRIAVLMVPFIVGMLFVSCALFQFGPSDEELISRAIDQFAKGVNEKNVDLVEAVLSEDFVNDEGEGKSATLASMPQVFDQMNPTMDVSEAVIAVEGGEATATPINLEIRNNAITVKFQLEKENSDWLITGMKFGY